MFKRIYILFFICVVRSRDGDANQESLLQKSINEKKYHYDSEVVTLQGRLVSETFPGPPEYSNIKEGDKPENFWILKLDQPISLMVEKGQEEEGLNVPERHIKNLQLVITEDKNWPDKNRLKKGDRAAVTGTLYHAHTIHHKTTVLIEVNELHRLK